MSKQANNEDSPKNIRTREWGNGNSMPFPPYIVTTGKGAFPMTIHFFFPNGKHKIPNSLCINVLLILLIEVSFIFISLKLLR